AVRAEDTEALEGQALLVLGGDVVSVDGDGRGIVRLDGLTNHSVRDLDGRCPAGAACAPAFAPRARRAARPAAARRGSTRGVRTAPGGRRRPSRAAPRGAPAPAR